MVSSSEDLQLSFRRSGGIFAGNRLALDLSAPDLPPEEASAWLEALRSGTLDEPGDDAAGADEYQYDLTVRGGGLERTVRFTESRLPAALAPLVRSLERRAEDEALRRRRH